MARCDIAAASSESHDLTSNVLFTDCIREIILSAFCAFNNGKEKKTNNIEMMYRISFWVKKIENQFGF